MTEAVRSRSRGLIVAASCAIALFAAWRIASLAIADFYADTDPARALQWWPGHPDALLMLAEKNVAGRKFDAAEALAKRALAANPLDGRAYRVLADVASARGDRERQQALIALAVQHAPRDIAARAWAAQIALERGDAAAAVAHYDRILRVAPRAQAEVFPVLAGLAATPGARGTITVSGPGQKACTSRSAAGGIPAAKAAACSAPATCTISGWSAGRPLAAKMAATARSSSARAPRP